MKHVILDCDPGHDDVLAPMMALYQTHDLDVTGVVTTAGNQSLSKVTHNAFNVLRYLHRDVPWWPEKVGPCWRVKRQSEMGMRFMDSQV